VGARLFAKKMINTVVLSEVDVMPSSETKIGRLQKVDMQ
jgi:hypothetical protein